MFALYLKILALNLGVTNFVLLMVAFASGRAIKTGDFLFPAAIQFLLVTLNFLVFDLLRAHASHVSSGKKSPEARSTTSLAASQRTFHGLHASTFGASQLDVPGFRAARQNSTKGQRLWNS